MPPPDFVLDTNGFLVFPPSGVKEANAPTPNGKKMAAPEHEGPRSEHNIIANGDLTDEHVISHEGGFRSKKRAVDIEFKVESEPPHPP
ncbi:hypothetical protein D3C87_1471160 [compost metagenome]